MMNVAHPSAKGPLPACPAGEEILLLACPGHRIFAPAEQARWEAKMLFAKDITAGGDLPSVSKAWNNPRGIFQGLEKMAGKFPRLGKLHGDFFHALKKTGP